MSSSAIMGIFAILIGVIGMVIMLWDSVLLVFKGDHIYEDYREDIEKEEFENDAQRID